MYFAATFSFDEPEAYNTAKTGISTVKFPVLSNFEDNLRLAAILIFFKAIFPTKLNQIFTFCYILHKYNSLEIKKKIGSFLHRFSKWR
jgi:hypothetical protein